MTLLNFRLWHTVYPPGWDHYKLWFNSRYATICRCNNTCEWGAFGPNADQSPLGSRLLYILMMSAYPEMKG